MKAIVLILLLLLLLLPSVLAEEESCGITNLAVCIPEKLYEFTLSLLSAPLQPFLSLVKSLLIEPVDIGLFGSVWAVMVYIISLFYGLLLLYSGFNFIVSGYDAVRREKAKQLLRSVVLMVVFVHASFFLYGLALDVSSLLTSGIFSIINPDFFLLTADSLPGLGLQIVLVIPYLLALLLTVVMLTLRYLLVAVGVVFFPIGIFFSFISPLNSYGKFIVNAVLLFVFLPFFQAVVLLAASKLLDVGFLSDFKIVVMIGALLLVDALMLMLALFVVSNAARTISSSEIGRAVISGSKFLS